MLAIQKYLKKNGLSKTVDDFILNLSTQEINNKKIYTLNYKLTLSPKCSEVNEARGLTLDENFDVVAISFARFISINDELVKHNNFNDKYYYTEKLDGSLIRIYYYENQWRIGTRGNALGDNLVNSFILHNNITYEHLIYLALIETHDLNSYKEMYELFEERLDQSLTYICEIVSQYNRIITKYTTPKLYFLSTRNNKTFESSNVSKTAGIFNQPLSYPFMGLPEIQKRANALHELEEGYVLYNEKYEPILKIKSHNYTVINYIKNNMVTNHKELLKLNEQTNNSLNFLEYFTNYDNKIQKYQNLISSIRDIAHAYSIKLYNMKFENRAEFAKYIMNDTTIPKPIKSLFLSATPEQTALQIFDNLTKQKIIILLKEFIKKGVI